ncbi:thiosulfohydrolase SoxB [Spectribacter hydrogenoxidans]|uniref:Thiosulfohydrolase SoxB n=1 Tax=Spectribacter hydrogenoxidans TaxID=3075608 RepID=A0ABU3BY68_9GAMM|nr:thiosulfohydrolase SoxB [Salinisphaera sp. W335]MDT0634084.1 thiosulfohydrolase SoxB [Salinisphaera sp. W335]
MQRREFLGMLAAAAAAGLPVHNLRAAARPESGEFYHVPAKGNVHFLHMTDTHAQLRPVYFREPAVNIGLGAARNRPPHLVGQHFLNEFGVEPGSIDAHAMTCLDFAEAANRYGRVGGFSHLATLVRQMRSERPDAMLLDGGDLWQGSATALWTKGQDMVDASLELGVEAMTGHWEFTLGDERVLELVENDLDGKIDFLAQNVRDSGFGDPIFKAYTMREMNGVPVAVLGQAFPYTPIANPSYMMPNWNFGIRESDLQDNINAARKEGAQVVILLSHNGMDVDLKLASNVTGLDAILGGHTHDAVPRPQVVKNDGGETIVANGGSNGKFLGVLDFDVADGKIRDWQYRLLPVFADMLPADPDMDALITKIREPYADKLAEELAVTEDVLYRRGNFNGTFDQLIVDALMEMKDADVALSPGFRWGTSLLPGDAITMERLMDQTAITYPTTTRNDMTGERLKLVLEDVADNLFNVDPYFQQGGDMVRVGGLTYAIAPTAEMGKRIRDMRIDGEPVQADRTYRVAGWASVNDIPEGEPIWDVVGDWLRDKKTITEREPNRPRIIGLEGNKGIV